MFADAIGIGNKRAAAISRTPVAVSRLSNGVVAIGRGHLAHVCAYLRGCGALLG
jgi:hypothetical protein